MWSLSPNLKLIKDLQLGVFIILVKYEVITHLQEANCANKAQLLSDLSV